MSTVSGRDRRRLLAASVLALLPIGCRPGEVAEQSPGKVAAAAAPDEYSLTAASIARHRLEVEVVELRPLQETFTAPARVAFNAETTAHVGSPLRGRVVDIPVRLGSRVKVGDVLVVIDSPELGEAQSEFLSRRGAAAASVPTADLAKITWERAKGLFESSQGMSLAEAQKREAEYRLALAAQQACEAAAVAAENRLHLLGMPPDAIAALSASRAIDARHAITAPVAGEVVMREVALGDLVAPERASLLTLADRSTLWILAAVPEARLQTVRVGARCWVQAASMLQKRHEGVVAGIAPMLDQATRTVEVRIEVTGDHDDLLPGMFARAEIAAAGPTAADRAPLLAIPETSLQMVAGRPVVFVPAAAADTFTLRHVVVGTAVAGWVPVLDGLTAGERVVTRGSFILRACAEQSPASEAR
jgi:cobalt-zinc-cadmium efflux system membrane fusion protein